MRWLFNIFVAALFFCILFFTLSVSAEMSPQEILSSADRARGNVEGIEWGIRMVSKERGRTRTRQMIVKVRDLNSLAEFTAPAKVKGQKVLMIDRNMWFVKPGLRKPVPISPRQKLMGQASNGDIASTNYAGDYEVEKMTEEPVDGVACYLFDLVASSKKVTYDRIRYWVSKKRLVGVKAAFFTVSGKMFKSATFEYDNRITVKDKERPFVSKMIITNAVIRADVTTMIYSKVRVKRLPDSVFNLNLLMR